MGRPFLTFSHITRSLCIGGIGNQVPKRWIRSRDGGGLPIVGALMDYKQRLYELLQQPKRKICDCSQTPKNFSLSRSARWCEQQALVASRHLDGNEEAQSASSIISKSLSGKKARERGLQTKFQQLHSIETNNGTLILPLQSTSGKLG
ncbi:hypothetical protein PIB30_006599 [Stylosanthes scabra]|uniref:Uncharacterized protein n=1 Tax=Stylosanthes scabra TaxID=79078 RepID=A0ABU6Z405_9FABA|nr:hypothetical protein [Stylosanthes scabra]